MKHWPNFFIVGTKKAGTTSLWNYLNLVPEVFMSSRKEPYFFSHDLISEDNPLYQPIRSELKYLDLFKHVKNEKAIGEASSSYFSHPESPIRIKKLIPNAKIIILLRDPVERAFSHYLYQYRAGLEKLPFDDAIKRNYSTLWKNFILETPSGRTYLEYSFYPEQVMRYLETFEKSNVKILFFEEFTENTKNTIHDILNFLEIDYNVDNLSFEKIHNAFGMPRNRFFKYALNNITIRKSAKILPERLRLTLLDDVIFKKTNKPKMSDETRSFLIDFFSEQVLQLQEILNRKPPWKNFL